MNSPAWLPARGAILLLLIPATALVWSFHLTSFLHAKETALCVALASLAFVSALSGRHAWRGVRMLLPLWLWLLYGAITSLWIAPAQVPVSSMAVLSRNLCFLLTAALVFDLVSDTLWRSRILAALIASISLVALLGLLQYAGVMTWLFPTFDGTAQRVYCVFGNQDLFGGYCAVGIPLLLTRVFRREHRPGISFVSMALLCLNLAALGVSGSRSAWLAALVGCIFVARSALRGVPLRKVALLLLPVMVVAAVILLDRAATLDRALGSFGPGDVGGRARLWFWDGALRMLADHPVTGVGLGNYGFHSPYYQGAALHAPGGEGHYRNELATPHPHSEPLAILCETGVVGGAFWIWMLALLLRRRGAEWGPMAALLVFSLFNAPFECAPHALAGLLLAMILLVNDDEPNWFWKAAYSPAPALILSFMAVCALSFHLWAVVVPSRQLRAAEDVHLEDPSRSLPLYRTALDHPMHAPIAREEYALALMQSGHPDVATQQFLYALGSVDSGRVYLALGMLAEERGDVEDARHWFEECLWRWPGNREARFYLEPE